MSTAEPVIPERRAKADREVSTRDAIRHAAIELFYQHGYSAATVRAIATKLGISAASIYNHNPSKQDILVDIMSRTNESLAAGLDDALIGVTKPIEKLRTVVRRHVLFHRDHDMEAFLADRELRNLEPVPYRRVVQQRKTYEHRGQAILEEGRCAGVFADVDDRFVSYAIITACSALGSWYRPSGPRSAEEWPAPRVRVDR